MKFNSDVTFIDLFAGIGGFRLAMENFGAKCVFSSEYDKYAQTTYEANFNEIPDGDITEINEKDIPSHDILCGGFPCQAFSISGSQKGFEDSRGTLFFEIARIVNYHRPKILFLENVANLKKHSDGETISKMIEILEGMDYNVYYQVLNASDYGVPQSRKRIYFLAFRDDLGVNDYVFPKATNEDVALEDILLSHEETKQYIIERNDIKFKDDTDLKERINKPIRIGTINKGGQGERVYSPKGHAITLSAYGGGAGSKTGAYLINGITRKLAPRECLSVLGFPTGYKLPVSDSQAWKQCGNSVAVPVLKKIIEEIIKLPELSEMTVEDVQDRINRVG